MWPPKQLPFMAHMVQKLSLYEHRHPEVYQDKFSVRWSWLRQMKMKAHEIKSQYAMKVDTHPFPAVHMVECTYPRRCQPGFSFSINMVGPGHHSEKKDGRWRVAIDFRDINRATPKDEYQMPVAETLINAAAGHKVLSFMDGNAGYNQIFMAPEDIHKTAFRIIVICKSDVVKHMLPAPVLKGRLALSVRAWAMFFDGSACDDGCGIGILLVSPRGATYSFAIRLSTPCTNNVAEYEAVRKGMELLLEAAGGGAFGDSKLVISQLTDEYKCESESSSIWMECVS
ncbi:hypothetical protein QYE76_025274 [Lolium multiflorum]|uniref:Reverse transcriptase domain-containing protein n=1 Tax=Lolium multiflorum TaxID=4521 RepID=A0AAD8VU35_LOLMU|nr:hypothetical protein QYE76_025274 [Lolium multiflorum]